MDYSITSILLFEHLAQCFCSCTQYKIGQKIIHIFLNLFLYQPSIINIPQNKASKMGCQPSQQTRGGPQIKISIVDSGFMKAQNKQIRNQMTDENITFECFISIECFFEEFTKRYYNKVVTNFQNYKQLKSKLKKIGLFPNIYVVLDGKKFEQSPSFNTVTVQNYSQLIKYLKQHHCPTLIPNTIQAINSTKRKIDVKMLYKPGPKSSQQQIFQTALKKFGISYEFFSSYQLLQHSIQQSQSDFIVTDYIFHKQVVELFKNTKTRVICYCSFQVGETYAPQIYSVSNNYLDIANDLKNSIKLGNKGIVKCSKVYLYTNNLDEQQDIKNTLQMFDIEVRTFSNLEKVIKQTTYFFCVTVISAQSEAKNVAKFLERNDYLERVKLLGIPKNNQATIKGLFKLIRNIKKGYFAQKTITNSIDIIDKHYNNVKFEEIKRQLQNNDIKCFGYGNLSSYIKSKKFISPFIICNFQERTLLLKYMKQLQCKSKIVIFCNKNKITSELKDNPNFSYVSSHFGKIIKFIRKTLVFLPILDRQQELLFKQKIDKIKNKNKRISALKWSQIEKDNSIEQKQQTFQFLNIAKETSNNSIKDIQKSISTIWKVDTSILQFQNFKNQFIKSLNELKKIHKINFSQQQFVQLIQKIKIAPVRELLQKVKTFFDADNELGLEINKSLMKTETLQKKQITNMRQFLLLVFLNFFSGYQMPRIAKKKVTHWISNPLIQKCQVGSYLFCKHFLIFYENSATTNLTPLGKYKIELQIQFNSLCQSQLFLNSYITYKDKLIFSPFSQFVIESIQDTGQFKLVTVKFIKNVDFLKFIYQDNLFSSGESMSSFVEKLTLNQNALVDSETRQKFIHNISRIKAVQLFQKGDVSQAIQIHKRLIKQNEQKQNLDSFLINELSFELSCFYFKANMNRQAAAMIKDLLQVNPGEFIKQQCQKMIKQVIDSDDKNEQKKGRRISEQAMKTFVWLKNKEQVSQESGCSSQQDINQPIKQQQINQFENEMKCMEIEDIDGMQEYKQTDMGKQNIK